MARRKRTIKSNKKNEQVQSQEDDLIVDLGQVSGEAQDFIERNQNLLFGGLVALVVLIGGYLAYKNLYVADKQMAAVDEMWKAENQFAQDSFALALENPGVGTGLVGIADDYGVTDASNAAAYYSAVGYLNLGQFDKAIEYLNDVDNDGQLMPVMKNGLLGDAHSEKGDFAQALSYYKKATTSTSNDVLTPYYLKKLGMLNEKQGDASAANAAYSRIKADFPNATISREVDKYIARTSN